MYNYKIKNIDHSKTKNIILTYPTRLSKSRLEAIVFKTFEEIIEGRIKDHPSYKVIPPSIPLLLKDVVLLLIEKGFGLPKCEQELLLNNNLTNYLLEKGYK